MASGKETYYRKRGYSRVHVKTWTIHLEKDGFVPCSFQNCKFMAFNIVEIKNHYNTCKGEVFQAPYECVYCKGLTEHADKLEEHILRFHGHSTSTASRNVHNIDTKRSKEPDEELFSIINEKSEISKVIIYSWDVSKEIYGYIKCPDCSLISETVEEMKSHIFNCEKNPSAFAYECHKCNGKVTSQTSLNHHMVECHSDSVLDDTFIENYSNFWKEQIDSHGFARCSNRCKFVHIDCSKLKQHFKASCSKEAGCHPVMYCDNKSCSVWSTSNLALVKHQQFEHEGKTSGPKDATCEMNSKKKIDKQICKNNSERNLTSRISESFSPKKEVTMMDSQVEGKCIKIEKRTKSRENATVGRSSLETKVPSSKPGGLKKNHGLEADSNTKISTSLKTTNMIFQHPKEVIPKEEIPKNDDLYQLQTPSDADNEITIDDPLACESEDQILFVKQNDYSRLEDGAFNKIKEEEIVSEEDDDDTNSIYSNTLASPGMKLIVENTIKCYSRMAEISKQNHSKQEHVTNPMNEPNGENIKERIESQIKRYDRNGDSPINMFSSRQRTYSSTKNIGKYNKKYGSSTENEIKPKLCDNVMLVRKDSSTLGDKKNDDVSKVTEISSSVCSTASLSATPNCDNTSENLVKNILEFKINTSKKQLLNSCGKSNNTRNRNQLEVEDVCKDELTEDASGTDESLNPQVDVSPPEENEPFNTCSHENVHSLNKNKKGRPKNISMEKDLVKNKPVTPQKRGRSERLRKMSSGLEPDLQGEVHNESGKDIQEKSDLAENERFKTVNSDLNYSVQTSLVKNDHLNSSIQVQKQKEALKMSGSSTEIAPKSKDESPTIQKKRGRPKKISLDSLSKSEKVVPTLNSQEEEEETFSNVVVEERKNVVECEPMKSEGRKTYKRRSIAKSSATKYHEIELGKTSASIENSDNNAQIIEKKQMGTKKMSFSREDLTSIPKKRGRPRKNSLDPTLSVQEQKQPESACSNINNNPDAIETTSTTEIVFPNIEVKARKKRQKSQKMCSRLEEEVSRGSEQEEIEKQMINNQEEVDTTIPEREKLEHNTEIPEAFSSDHAQISEEISTASSFPNIQKKRGRSKRRKLGQDETLKSFDEACTQIENRKRSLDSTHQNSKMKDSTDYVENAFDEHPNIDSYEKSTTNVVEETSIPIAPMKRKPGRPRKSVPALVPVLIEPNIDIESMANRDLDNSPKSNVSESKKTADYFAEHSNLDDDESVPEIESVSVISCKPYETPASSITDKNSKKKLGRPRKRSAINASENDQEIHTEENVPSKGKKTSSKPFKRSSYALDKSDLEETLGDDGEENPSKTLKRRLGRGKKMSATALDFSVDAENFNKSLETKRNLCSTPRRPARSITKPKKYKGFLQESLIESRRSSLNSDDSAHDTQDKEWHLSDAVENVEIDPLDKNENHSSVESPKPSKAISGKKKKMPPRRTVQLISCAICKKTMTRSQFETHAAEHNYFCWIEGDMPYDFEKEDDIHRNFFVVRRFKSFRGFKCDKCGAVKKSSVGYLSHKSMCGASQVEKENLKVCCPVCKRFMLPSSLKVHMGTDHRPTTKLPIQQEAQVTDSSNKRAAATRAELNFEDELDAMESEEAKEQQVRKWFCSKKKDHTTLTGEELDLEINSELMCRQPSCSFKTDDLDTLQAHQTTCLKLNRDYECRICGIRVKELLDIKHHILTNHAQVIENDHSDFELGEESEQDEDFPHQENKNPSQPNLVHLRPRFVADEAQRTGLNFIYRHMQRNHDRLQANFQDSSLYKEHLAVPNGFLNEDDLLHYLPKTQESMRISTGTEHWEQLKLMECRTIEGMPTLLSHSIVLNKTIFNNSVNNINKLRNITQSLSVFKAVSCHPDMDAVYSMGDVHSHKNLIQIWDFGPLNLCSSVLPWPTLSIGIAHSQGTAWDVSWCPEGCHQPDSGRLGLLAVAFSSGIAHIYSVPLVTIQTGKPFYKLTPVVELTPPYDEPVQCVRITWSSDSPFNVVAVGFIDGTIALYNITTSSILLRDGIKIHPYKVFTAHTESITGLQFISNKTGDILMSSSLDKTLKFWNLLDTSAPISTCRKITPIRDAMWLNNWLCAVSVNDDGYTNGMSHLHLNNFRDLFYLQTVPWIPVDNTQWSVTASEWSNSIAMASETGEIRIVYPHQLFSIDKSTKRASVQATTRTTLIKLHSEGELDTSGPSNYKDAAENYGLVFTENQGATENPGKEKSATKCLFPVKSINKISFNPNRQAFTYLAIGYHCGVVRVIRDKHFDYAKAEINNFADSLLMR
ncbi:uncharacterized protein LOC111050416 [Nilaparvata lugens]|uniref:uncharacterized protein LOC111050416 n=1 Tax=Nilaparvata lugens TaxID=108931 RepID=UPI00193D5B3E|nr:uncharacterized protein LOC111050416 [Nilaparvata lugens]